MLQAVGHVICWCFCLLDVSSVWSCIQWRGGESLSPFLMLLCQNWICNHAVFIDDTIVINVDSRWMMTARSRHAFTLKAWRPIWDFRSKFDETNIRLKFKSGLRVLVASGMFRVWHCSVCLRTLQCLKEIKQFLFEEHFYKQFYCEYSWVYLGI